MNLRHTARNYIMVENQSTEKKNYENLENLRDIVTYVALWLNSQSIQLLIKIIEVKTDLGKIIFGLIRDEHLPVYRPSFIQSSKEASPGTRLGDLDAFETFHS